MATYIEVTEAQSNPFAPVTSELIKQLRDNPIAAQQAANGAPFNRAVWHPYNWVDSVVDTTKDGLIYDHAVDGNVTSIETPTFENGFEYRLIFDGAVTSGADATQLRIELFKEVGAAYVGPFALGTPGDGASDGIRRCDIELPGITRVTRFHGGTSQNFWDTATGTPGITLTHFGFYQRSTVGAATRVTKARISVQAVNITGGTLKMLKRLDISEI